MNVTPNAPPFPLRRERYQSGSLKLEKRNAGTDVWVYRWREYRHDGTSTYRKKIVGPVTELRTKAAAQKAVEGLALDINAMVSAVPASHSVAELVAHYKETELRPDSKTALTINVYRHHIDNVILPHWGKYRLSDVKPIFVERWLSEMSGAPSTKAKTRNVFSALYQHARRYEWAPANPISLVRQSAKRQTEPDILTPEELTALLEGLSEPSRTLVIAASVTGLRRGELFGLRWQDVDFQNGKINIVRSLVDHVEGQPKTATSRRPIPLTPALASVLESWKKQTKYTASHDWVFASPAAFGQMPYWPDMLLKRHIRPAAVAARISKKIGWHTFRRTTATLLLSTGASIRVTQELLRHASPVMTLGTYSQAITEDKMDAQAALASRLGVGMGIAGTEAQTAG